MDLVAEPSGARVRRAFAFVDICGFTNLADEHGDDAAVQALVDFRHHVRAACGHYGVRVAKWLGDGAMLVGVDPVPLVCATFEIVATDVDEHHRARTRGGTATGEVLMFEGDDYIGRVVNLAARLCDVAPAGHLFAATSAAGELPASLRLEPRGPWVIPGFRAPVDVASVQLAEAPGAVPAV